MSFGLGVLLFAVGIGLSVALHEFGHLLTAKAFGMKATRYFIGFGPTLFSFRRGETEYGLKAVPAGGFVAITGMNRAEPVGPADEPRAFWRFPAWKRTVVLSAGSLTHFLVAILIIYVAAMTAGLPARALLGEIQPCVTSQTSATTPLPDCGPAAPPAPAAQAGLREGDRLVSLGGQEVGSYAEILAAVRSRPGQTVPVTFVRDGVERTVTLKIAEVRRAPLRGESADADGLRAVGAIGVAPGPATERFGPVAAVGQTARFTGSMFSATATAIANFPEKVPSLFHALAGEQRDPDGPVSVVGASRAGGQALEAGFALVFVLLLAGFNIFIGVFNLFPLLPLDGGHIAVLWFERARSRIARALGRRDPGPVDLNKLVPLTVLVIVVFGGISVMAILADIVNPIANPFQ